MSSTDKLKLVALLPMKANSQRVPEKNFRTLHGKPMFRWILGTLLAIDEIDRIVINTDARDILQEKGLVESDRIQIRERKPEICGDTVSMNRILADDIQAVPADAYLMTHTTNPMLAAATIREALAQLRQRQASEEADSLFSVNRVQTRFYRADGSPVNHDPTQLIQTQDLEPWFEENSCLYLFTAQSFAQTNARIGRKPMMFETPVLESVDIDTPDDWKLAEAIAAVLHGPPPPMYGALSLSEHAPPTRVKKASSSLENQGMPHKVLITAPYLLPFMEEYRPMLESRGCEVVVADVEERLSEAELLPLVGDIEGVICGDDQWTDAVMAAAPRLKVLSKWGTGIDSIDQEAAKQRGIAIRNVPNAFSEPLADTIFGWMLWFARRLPEQVEMMRAGGWDKIPGHTLGESTLGVIGVGNVGKAVIHRARAFNMTILGTDIAKVDDDFVKQHAVQMVPLEELLSQSDYVVLNCDLNATSRYLIRSETLALMKPSAVLMNAARGPVVKESDLIEALQVGKLHGAALDVFEQEPLAKESPLRSMNNVIMSAHNSNSSPKAWGAVHERAIQNLIVVLTSS